MTKFLICPKCLFLYEPGNFLKRWLIVHCSSVFYTVCLSCKARLQLVTEQDALDRLNARSKEAWMHYYYLRCETCKEDFKPLIATSREELTQPDYDQVEGQAGHANRDRFEDFHRKHMGHELAALELS